VIQLFDAIHVQLMHAFNSGQRLTKKEEQETQMTNNNSNNNNNSNSNNYDEYECIDTTTQALQQLTNERFTMYVNMRSNEEHKNSKKQIVSKFVTIIDDSNNTSDRLIYSSGFPFKYWRHYLKKQNIEKNTNSNNNEHNKTWFVRQKFENIKDELLFNDIFKLKQVQLFNNEVKKP
jgi:glycerophosphoryl diester phosphodiesterase